MISVIFGKIEYLNLLPFHVFMKRFNRSLQQNKMMEYKKNVPSAINKKFQQRKVDAAFISSIKAQGHRHAKLGIIARKEVVSVLVVPGESYKKDSASATSNMLAKLLGLRGEVIIGDRALRYALEHKEYLDLASLWHSKTGLPFVFALLCFHKETKKIKKIEKSFGNARVKLPRYILQHAAEKTQIKPKEIINYLTNNISYKLDKKASLGLKRFYRGLQEHGYKKR
jgi:chorismate dehydratase